jgi:hypothetical protein
MLPVHVSQLLGLSEDAQRSTRNQRENEAELELEEDKSIQDQVDEGPESDEFDIEDASMIPCKYRSTRSEVQGNLCRHCQRRSQVVGEARLHNRYILRLPVILQQIHIRESAFINSWILRRDKFEHTACITHDLLVDCTT